MSFRFLFFLINDKLSCFSFWMSSFYYSCLDGCDSIRGNQAYDKGNPSKAEEFYTKGINSVPHSGTSGCCIAPLVLCYSNRAAARMSLGRMREALGDCTRAAALDPNFHKVQIRAAKYGLVLCSCVFCVHSKFSLSASMYLPFCNSYLERRHYLP